MDRTAKAFSSLLILLIPAAVLFAQDGGVIKETYVGEGWAKNSVNTVIFRKNSIVSKDSMQFIGYYNEQADLMIGKRTHNDTSWTIRKTPYQGNAWDAHNTISIVVDGDGYLHVSWDQHNTRLRYAKSVSPASLKLSEEISMTGDRETSVSYPEFYKLPDGNLLFFYRNGESGKGNLVINKYDLATKSWSRLHTNLIDGEGERNAYWQACVDHQGTIHLSWVWRENPDVASNHDICYAKSVDGGITWQQSDGKIYKLPITATTAEYARKIPENTELINQTSMTTNSSGQPYIVSYWRPESSAVPQFHLLYYDEDHWQVKNLGFRKMAFSLSGEGTKQIPISRPQVIVAKTGKVYVLFRDEERKNSISVASGHPAQNFEISDLIRAGYGSWEPTYDTELWKYEEKLHLFIQNVTQIDGEGIADQPGSPVKVLEWTPEDASQTGTNPEHR